MSVNLATDRWPLDLLPDLGGRIASLRWRHPAGDWIDLLVPIKGHACTDHSRPNL